MTTAQRPARALVHRRRCEGLSLSGGPSGLAGIATLLISSFRHSRPGADFVRGAACATVEGWQGAGKIAAAEAVAYGVRGREHHSGRFLPHLHDAYASRLVMAGAPLQVVV